MSEQFDQNVFDQVFDGILTKETDTSINVFLCGRRITGSKSIRERLFDRMRSDKKFNVVFAEDLFASLTKKEGYDLLELERELAEYVDVILLPLDGPGTFAELGAFVSIPRICDKVIAINRSGFSKQSFISQGPLKHIQKQHKNFVIEFTDEASAEFDSTLDDLVARLRYHPRTTSRSELRNVFNMSKFLFYLIALYQPVDLEMLVNQVAEWRKTVPPHVCEASIAILLKGGLILDAVHGRIRVIRLSQDGHSYWNGTLLPTLRVSRLYSELRAHIMYERRSYKRRIDVGREGDKLRERLGIT